jgi:thymidylate kinase
MENRLSTTRPLKSPSVFHIEGMDLAGKSTATAALQRLNPGCEVRHNSLTIDNPIFSIADGLRRSAACSSEVLGHLYVAAALQDIAAYVQPTRITVQDSTVLLRSLAFYTVMGNESIVERLTELLPLHPRFDCSIVLTASVEARLNRLEQRFRDAPDDVAPDDLAIRTNPKRFLDMEEALVNLAVTEFRAHVIDTSDMTRETVIGAVTALTATAQELGQVASPRGVN